MQGADSRINSSRLLNTWKMVNPSVARHNLALRIARKCPQERNKQRVPVYAALHHFIALMQPTGAESVVGRVVTPRVRRSLLISTRQPWMRRKLAMQKYLRVRQLT